MSSLAHVGSRADEHGFTASKKRFKVALSQFWQAFLTFLRLFAVLLRSRVVACNNQRFDRPMLLTAFLALVPQGDSLAEGFGHVWPRVF